MSGWLRKYRRRRAERNRNRARRREDRLAEAYCDLKDQHRKLWMLLVLVVLIAAVLLSGCATAPEFPPLPPAAPKSRARQAQVLAPVEQPPSLPPLLVWNGCEDQAYFVNWAPFSLPDVYVTLAGPMLFLTTNMEWRTIEQGLYNVGTEWPRITP